jgi:ABC-2 type transport system permease protein
MFFEIFRFEIRHQLRQPLFWVVFLTFALMTFGAETTDSVSIGGGIGNVHRNAPTVIIEMLMVMSVIGMFVATAFVASAIHRDVEHGTADLFFTTPIGKGAYLGGRFAGALVVSFLVYLGPALGLLIGSLMPWLEPERIGPFTPAPYLFALFVVVLPNLLFASALFFALAALSRSLLFTYLGVVAFLVLYLITGNMLQDVDNRQLASLADPFAGATLDFLTRYWTVVERNSSLPPLLGPLLWNRLLWSLVAGLILVATYVAFSPSREGNRLLRRRARVAGPANGANEVTGGSSPSGASPRQASPTVPADAPPLRHAAFAQFRHQLHLEVTGVLKSVPFLVMLAFGLFNVIGSSSFIDQMFGTAVYPVTHLMLSNLEGSYVFLLVIIVTFYAGELVWKERGLKLAEVYDALPIPNWVPLLAKIGALWAVIAVFLLAGALGTMGFQLWNGWTRLEPLLYLQGLAMTFVPFALMAVLAVFLQVVANHKFIGYLLMILYLVSATVLAALDFDHNLYRFAGSPPTSYSDMNGWGHFVTPQLWFWSYWGAFSLLLAIAAALFWMRGTGHSWKDRLGLARARFRGASRGLAAVGTGAFLGTGAFIFYNTNLLNRYVPGDVREEQQARWEQKYRQYKDVPLPRIIAAKVEVDIFPRERRMATRGVYTLENRTGEPIAELHVNCNPETIIDRLELPPHTVVTADPELGYWIYRLAEPLAPGARMELPFAVRRENRGFRNGATDTNFVANGTFFNNRAYLPNLGYDPGRELQDRNDRRKHGLPPVQRMNKIDDQQAWNHTYLGADSDWIQFEATVSTDVDQIALAPGYLEREWTADGRRYFHYAMDAPILNFWAFLSARWEVRRDVWRDTAQGREVAIEIYYQPGHEMNVDRMVAGVKRSLDYFSANFSPYQHRQVRILEFPRYDRFAQAFPNTIPFSESIGFIADLRDEEAIDYVFYVTAHEVAHQWWAHQVIGADVQGATVLSESLSQYSALMVMEKEYGREKMRRFLKYELDNYLRGRGGELVEELPLALVENQPYIHYRKGSLVFYQLREALGEEVVNAVLAQLIRDYGFRAAPFPTSRELVARLRTAAAPEHHGLIDDLFERITLFENRVESASATAQPDGSWRVEIATEARKLHADGQGIETETTMDDFVEIGVFARPEGGKESEERPLVLERVRLGAGQRTFTFEVAERPYEVGIDPYNKLIDRKSDDNRKRVEITTGGGG